MEKEAVIELLDMAKKVVAADHGTVDEMERWLRKEFGEHSFPKVAIAIEIAKYAAKAARIL